jgi:hypothetical protein
MFTPLLSDRYSIPAGNHFLPQMAGAPAQQEIDEPTSK